MAERAHLKYGLIKGSDLGVPMLMTDAEVIKDQSGRFASITTGTGYLTIADTTGVLVGWIESPAVASCSTTWVKLLFGFNSIFRMPLVYDATYTVNYSSAILFEYFDLYVGSSIQYADLTNPSAGQLICCGGQAGATATEASNDGWVDCYICPETRSRVAASA